MKRDLDMLHGPIWNKMILFALPLVFSSTLQQMFNAADVAVVGRFAGHEALAAVGSNSSMVNLLVNLFVGLSVGSNAVISRYIGEGKTEKVSAAVHTSVFIALLSGVFLSFAGIILARPLLTLLGTPANILQMAALYLTIYFIGMPFIMLYNFTAAILRSKGDTKRPMLALITAGALNLVLNLVFVVVLKMSVSGVAIATVMANGIGSLWLASRLSLEKGDFHLSLRRLSIDFEILKEISLVGVPAGLQAVIFSVSNVMIQSAVNHLGHLYIAANTTAASYDYIAFFIFSAFNSAALTFISQNYAAKNPRRARRCAMWAFVLSSLIGLVVNGIFIFTRSATIGLFTADLQVQKIACIRIVILLSFEFFNGTIEVCSGILRGFGRTIVPTVTVLVGICGIRIAMICLMPQTASPYEYLMSAFPVTWIATAAVLGAASLKVLTEVRREEQHQMEYVPAMA
ncbi:MAG: MATE family efflux transporter [Erysipelotrichaceae bacterium]|nr:MATE family efflux transporter [Erysipelotrichaceae bacterium]